jgi:hypothetical protein
MLATGRLGRIDLFDDPSWDSPEAMEEAAAYERLVVSGFSSRTEWAVLILSVVLVLMFIASTALLVWTVGNALNSLISQALAGLDQLFASM